MTQIETEEVAEESTIVAQIDLEDEDGTPRAPKSATWTLTDRNGNVVNTRRDVDITPLASTMHVVISGDDLSLLTDEIPPYQRYFLFECVYDSNYGNDLPYKKQVLFTLEDFIDVT